MDDYSLAVDVGGTFTDIVLCNLTTNEQLVHKTPSTPDDPSTGFLTGLREVLATNSVEASQVKHVFHGTTIATNAILENKGSPVGLVVPEGFKYVLKIRPFSDDNIWENGDLVRVYTVGGGGWGDPLERETERVLDDVTDGFVSVAAAEDSFGVVIDPDTLVIDQRATTALRQEIGTSRDPTKLFHRFNYFDTAEEELEWVEKNIPR
jgi:hypothetical protein